MVLDEASPAAPETFSDDISNDADQYASTAGSSSRPSSLSMPSSIELDKLARPVPILGPVFGFNDAVLQKIIEFDAANMSAILQRPLTLPEWQSAAFHMAKMQSYSSYGWPIGFACGAWQARRTMNEWRFPFYKPNLEKIGQDRFDRFWNLRGQMARSAWQSVRFGSYMGVVGLGTKLAFNLYAMNVAIAGQRVDDRMSDFWNTLKSLSREEVRRRRTTVGSPSSYNASATTGFSVASEEGSEGRPRVEQAAAGDQGVWARRRAAAARGEAPSPGGAFGEQQPDHQSEPAGSGFDLGDSDDVSPMAREESQSSGSSTQDGAWDRVRRGNAPRRVPQQPTRPLQGAQGDPWSRVRGNSSDGGGNEGDQMG